MIGKTMLVHPQGLLRCALKELLSVYGLTEEICTALTTEDAITDIPAASPDILIYCDSSVANGTTDELRRIRQRFPTLPILVIGDKDHPLLVRQWLDAGANGFVATSHSVDELKKAMAAFARGENYVPASLARALVFGDTSVTSAGTLATLSKRELQVLVHVVEGGSIQEISARLCISPKTVGTYRHRLFRKLNLRNDAELTQLALSQGLTSIAPLPAKESAHIDYPTAMQAATQVGTA